MAPILDQPHHLHPFLSVCLFVYLSCLQWMYIIPVVLFLMMSGAPDAGGQGGGGGGGSGR